MLVQKCERKLLKIAKWDDLENWAVLLLIRDQKTKPIKIFIYSYISWLCSIQRYLLQNQDLNDYSISKRQKTLIISIKS
jgi:hypothetical protein